MKGGLNFEYCVEWMYINMYVHTQTFCFLRFLSRPDPDRYEYHHGIPKSTKVNSSIHLNPKFKFS